MKIKELSKEHKPREKALLNGFENLSNDELLAIILECGTKELNVVEVSEKLYEKCHGFMGIFNADISYLSSFKGIGKIKAIKLKALGEMLKRTYKENLTKINKPKALDLFKIYEVNIASLEKETLILLLYNRHGQFLGERNIFVGTTDSLLISHHEILKVLLRNGAYSFYLLHNHPSGNPLPSKGEISDTLKLKKEAFELNLHLLDHVILTKTSYFSFKENNLFKASESM